MSTPTPYRIVVGFDFTPEGTLALRQAMNAASKHPRACIHVLSVLATDRRHRGLSARPTAEAAETLRASIQELLTASPSLSGVTAFAHARIGVPADELLLLSQEVHADLVVVGTHGRTGVKRLTLGSVAEEIVRNAPCPVLIARDVTYPDENPAFAPEPACPRCTERKRATGTNAAWCDEHSRPYTSPVVFHVSAHAPGEAPTGPMGIW